MRTAGASVSGRVRIERNEPRRRKVVRVEQRQDSGFVLHDERIRREVGTGPAPQHEPLDAVTAVGDVDRVHGRRPRVAEPAHAHDPRAGRDRARDPRERVVGRPPAHRGRNLGRTQRREPYVTETGLG